MRSTVVPPTVFWTIVSVLLATLLFMAFDTAASLRPDSPIRDKAAAWRAREPRHYRYTVTVECGACSLDRELPYTMEVRDGRVVAASQVLVDSSGTHMVAVSPRAAVTIARLFGVLTGAARTRAEWVKVDYDPTFGYPTRVQIDQRFEATDDEVEYAVSGFQLLP